MDDSRQRRMIHQEQLRAVLDQRETQMPINNSDKGMFGDNLCQVYILSDIFASDIDRF